MNTIAERIKFAMNVRNVKASGNGTENRNYKGSV